MDAFIIPDVFLPGFEELIKLDESNFKKAVKLLKKMPIGIHSKTFRESLKKEIKITNIDELTSTLYSLGGLLVIDDSNINQLSADLTVSLKELSKIKLTSKMLNKFQERLKILFVNCENLKITFKAFSLCFENDKVYKQGRIFTDIRIIFNNDLKDTHRNAVILHQLKIEFEKNEEQNNLFLALDSDDLLNLKEQIERAIEKEKQIKSSYGETVNIIDINV